MQIYIYGQRGRGAVRTIGGSVVIHLPGGNEQPPDLTQDGINVAAWSTGDVRMVFTEAGAVTAFDLNPLLALEVAQRLLQMALFQLVQAKQAEESPAQPEPPKLVLVHGTLPKGGQ